MRGDLREIWARYGGIWARYEPALEQLGEHLVRGVKSGQLRVARLHGCAVVRWCKVCAAPRPEGVCGVVRCVRCVRSDVV